MPGISKKPSFSHQDSAPSSPSKKTVRLAENPHVSAFLSPKSRIFTGGHGYPGPPGPMARQSYASASAVPDAFSVNGKQLTPDEVAQKIASMLKPGPPFFSRVSNADLIDFISDGSIMNCDKLRAAAAAVEERKHANRALRPSSLGYRRSSSCRGGTLDGCGHGLVVARRSACRCIVGSNPHYRIHPQRTIPVGRRG